MTVFELLRDKFAEECEDGLTLTFSDNGRGYTCDFTDDYAAETYGNRDVSNYSYYFSKSAEETDQLVIELA